MNTVLRLLILLSVVGGGLKQKTYDSVRREFLQVSCVILRCLSLDSRRVTLPSPFSPS